MLSIENLSRSFGGVLAVDGATASFAPGTVTGLIGPNGAGKTTIFNLVTGLVAPTGGRVVHDGQDITGLRPYQVARKGIGRTFQHTRIVRDLTAGENVMLANPALTPSIIRMVGLSRQRRREFAGEAESWLDRVGLAGRAGERGADLSYAEQKLVMLACLLASGARTLLLDEPTAGLDPESRRRIVETVASLRDPGTTIVLVEHNLDVVRGLCDRIVFLAEGRVLAEGTPAEIESDPRLASLYFGGGGHA
jgi:ABC-type branched-subunit amino acid transport system ATPase component